MASRPWFTASYSAPCPRRCSGASDSPASVLTGPSAHSTASASSNSSSPRAVRQAWKSSRNRDSKARDSTSGACSSKLSITAFVVVMCPLARTNDHAKAALTPGDTPGTAAQDPQTAQASAWQVKRQARGLLRNWLTWGYAFPGLPAACSIESGGGEGLPPGGPGPAVSSAAGYAPVAAGGARGVAGDRGGGRAGHLGVPRAAADRGRGGGGL